MSTPQWKIDRDRREAAEKARREEEARKKQAKLDEELGHRKAELAAERAKRDAEDEAKIQAHQRELAAAGVKDKEEALKKATVDRNANTICCKGCGKSLYNTGPFTRCGPETIPYEQRDPYHKTCLYCDVCSKRGQGIQMVDGKKICFDCRASYTPSSSAAPAAAPAPSGFGFCGECGTPKKSADAAFCGNCGNKLN